MSQVRLTLHSERLRVRTFISQQGQSPRFWNIQLKGARYTITYGRSGGQGRTLVKKFTSPKAARAAHDKAVREILARGYVETSPASAPASEATAAPVSALRATLEQALQDDPDDVAAHAAYADLLTEEGDPRGELIRLQLALEDEQLSAEQRKELRRREQQLLRAHQREWLGDLAGYFLDRQEMSEYLDLYRLTGPGTYRFARGWLNRLHIHGLTVRLALRLARAPETRLLRELVIETVSDGSGSEQEFRQEYRQRFPHEHSIGLCPLLDSPYLGNLRLFHLGTDDGDNWETFRCYLHSALIPDLLRKMPRLEELYLYANGFDISDIFQMTTLTHLRILKAYHMDWPHRLELLAANRAFGRLTGLLFHPHHARGADEADLSLSHVRALVRCPHLPNLRHLQLRVCDMGDAGCAEIVRSGVLKRLRVLDLRHGCVTDEGARILADCPDLRNLELLDLDRNGLTPAGIAALEATGINLRADNQQTEQELADGQFLYEGEFE
jgi:uncharacterized protein (TIGR02996 family)